MLLEAYIALAIIFAAKTIIRDEDIKKILCIFLVGRNLFYPNRGSYQGLDQPLKSQFISFVRNRI
jgi:hypothetical protein